MTTDAATASTSSFGREILARVSPRTVRVAGFGSRRLVGVVGRASVGFSRAIARSQMTRPAVAFGDLNSPTLRPPTAWRHPFEAPTGRWAQRMYDKPVPAASGRAPTADRSEPPPQPSWTDRMLGGRIDPSPIARDRGPAPVAASADFEPSGDRKLDGLRRMLAGGITPRDMAAASARDAGTPDEQPADRAAETDLDAVVESVGDLREDFGDDSVRGDTRAGHATGPGRLAERMRPQPATIETPAPTHAQPGSSPAAPSTASSTGRSPAPARTSPPSTPGSSAMPTRRADALPGSPSPRSARAPSARRQPDRLDALRSFLREQGDEKGEIATDGDSGATGGTRSGTITPGAAGERLPWWRREAASSDLSSGPQSPLHERSPIRRSTDATSPSLGSEPVDPPDRPGGSRETTRRPAAAPENPTASSQAQTAADDRSTGLGMREDADPVGGVAEAASLRLQRMTGAGTLRPSAQSVLDRTAEPSGSQPSGSEPSGSQPSGSQPSGSSALAPPDGALSIGRGATADIGRAPIVATGVAQEDAIAGLEARTMTRPQLPGAVPPGGAVRRTSLPRAMSSIHRPVPEFGPFASPEITRGHPPGAGSVASVSSPSSAPVGPRVSARYRPDMVSVMSAPSPVQAITTSDRASRIPSGVRTIAAGHRPDPAPFRPPAALDRGSAVPTAGDTATDVPLSITTPIIRAAPGSIRERMIRRSVVPPGPGALLVAIDAGRPESIATTERTDVSTNGGMPSSDRTRQGGAGSPAERTARSRSTDTALARLGRRAADRAAGLLRRESARRPPAAQARDAEWRADRAESTKSDTEPGTTVVGEGRSIGPPSAPAVGAPSSGEALADRFMSALADNVQRRPAPLPTPYRPMAEAITPGRRVMLSTDDASRRALRSVGKVAATTGDVIHLDRPARPSVHVNEVIAHELTHVAHPSPEPRFFDDIDDSPEERRADEVGRLMARSPLAPSSTLAPAGGSATGVIRRRAAAPSASSSPSSPAATPGSVDAASLADSIGGRSAPSSNAETIRRRSAAAGAALAPAVGAATPDTAVASPSMPEGTAAGDRDEWFDRQLELRLDRIVQLLEERMVIDLERRGGRYLGGM